MAGQSWQDVERGRGALFRFLNLFTLKSAQLTKTLKEMGLKPHCLKIICCDKSFCCYWLLTCCCCCIFDVFCFGQVFEARPLMVFFKQKVLLCRIISHTSSLDYRAHNCVYQQQKQQQQLYVCFFFSLQR